jgi:hypothetical protein
MVEIKPAPSALGHLHRAVLEFGDLAEHIERRVDEQIGRRLIMVQ